MSEKEYLGDGVYAETEHGMIKLTTTDGLRDTKTIYLEREVFVALLRFARRNEFTVGVRTKPDE